VRDGKGARLHIKSHFNNKREKAGEAVRSTEPLNSPTRRARPNNTNCSFSIKVTYTDGTTNTIQIQTGCDFLKDCANSCRQSSPYEEPIKDYLNSIFHFIASGGNPTSPILLTLLPAVLKEKDGQTAYNVTLNQQNNFVVNISYNPLHVTYGERCIITLHSNPNISSWNQVIHISSITPDFSSVNGITHAQHVLQYFQNKAFEYSKSTVK